METVILVAIPGIVNLQPVHEEEEALNVQVAPDLSPLACVPHNSTRTKAKWRSKNLEKHNFKIPDSREMIAHVPPLYAVSLVV